MMKKYFCLAMSALVTIAATSLSMQGAVGTEKTRLYFYDTKTLQTVKELYEKHDPSLTPVVRKLQRDANKALDIDPPTVMHKDSIPPTGDRHDYMSMARYWWPDPAAEKGLPYIRKDGEVNPETRGYSDHEELMSMVKNMTTLSLGYYFFEREKYAEKAVELIRVWFLDSTTMMNPNLNFAQFVPGRNTGRGSGVLDGREFSMLLDMVSILKTSPSWTETDQQGLSRWFTQYLEWLRNSKNGKHESDTKNNHGTWYDVQTASIELFLGKEDRARELISTAKQKRIGMQITPEGEQPEELVRTKSLDYSLFNLEALMRLALLGDAVGIDLWHYRAPKGGSLKKAIDYLLPFVSGEKKWERPQIIPVKDQTIFLVFTQAYRHYGGSEYRNVIDHLKGIDRQRERMILLYGVQF